MIDPSARPQDTLKPVSVETAREADGVWTERLVVFLRVMAGLSLLKGLYYWAVICGFVGVADGGFEALAMPTQTATVFFAIIDLVAAVGLWLAAAWGAVVWLTSAVSLAAVELLFPQIYGGRLWVVVVALLFIVAYLLLAIMAARERPP
jgi:hypothetical protein